MVLHKTRLQGIERDFSPVRGGEAVSLVHRLTIEGWTLAGRELPAYPRARIPVRFVAGRLT